MDWSTGIALVSLLVSLFVLWRQQRALGRAHFTTEWETHDSLVFINQGPGAATNLSATVQSEVRTETIETAYMGAFQSMRVHVINALGASPAGPLQLTWRDNRFRPQQIALELPQQPRLPQVSTTRHAIEKAVRAVALEVTREEMETQQRFAATMRRSRR